MSFLKSPFRKKGRKQADSVDSDQGGGSPSKFGGPGSTTSSTRRSAQAGADQRKSGDFDGVRRSSVGSKGSPREAIPPPSGHGETGRASPQGARMDRNGGGGSARGAFASQQQQQQQHHHQQHGMFNHHASSGVPGVMPHGRGSPKGIGMEEADGEMEDSIPAEWAQKPSRERRFTMGTRPDLHMKRDENIDDIEEDEATERAKDMLNEMLEDMVERVEALKEEELNQDEEGNEEGKDDLDLDERNGRSRGGGGLFHGSPTGSRNSGRSGGSKRRGKFTIPKDLAYHGDMYKRGARRKNWKKRTFVLNPRRRILTYHPLNSQVVKGTIDLRDIKVELPDMAREHKNKKINPDFEFYLIENATRRAEPRRKYEFACTDEVTFFEWVSRLQTIVQLIHDHKNMHPRGPKGARGVTIEDDEADHTAKYDEAQNWTAFGRGLYETRIGEPARFTIQANDRFGDPQANVPDGVLSVVLESEDLHFDVTVTNNMDGTFTAEYCPTRLGDYELSVMLDGFDIYGSPFFPKVLPAGIRTTHCTAEGLGILCALLDEPNVFIINLKNEFDETVIPEEDEVNFYIEMEKPLVLEELINNKDGTFKVVYKVDCSADELRKLQAENDCLTGSIKVYLEDFRYRIKYKNTDTNPVVPQIKGSPFKPGIAASLNPDDLAAAYSAAEFSKILQENMDASGGFKLKDVQNPFIAFSQVLKTNGYLLNAMNHQKSNQPNAEADEQPKSPYSGVSSYDGDSSPPPPTATNNLRPPQINTQPEQQQQQQQQQRQPPQTDSAYAPSSYFAFGPTATAAGPAPPMQPSPSANTMTMIPTQRHHYGGRDEWVPHDQESKLVRTSLEERAREIEFEKQELIRKRQELDESRNLIDEQVRRMAEIGRKVQHDSERMVEQAKRLNEDTYEQQRRGPPSPSPMEYAVKENLIDPNQRSRFVSEKKSPSGGVAPVVARSSNSKGGVVLDKPLIALFDKHALVLSRVYEYYKMDGGTHLIQLSDVIKLSQDYDITPTFISRKEIRDIVMNIEQYQQDEHLSYEAFVEVLANIAVHSLSKPMFAHLYSTNLSKVNVLLTMWGLADPVKLSEIQRQQQD